MEETVPVERVRVDTQVEESVQTVEDDLRKERITLEDDTAVTTRAAFQEDEQRS